MRFYFRLRAARPPGHGAVGLRRDVEVRAIRQEDRRHDGDDRAEQDVERDHITRPGRRQERRRDQRRRTAGGDRGEMETEREPAVAQPRRKAFGDQRPLRTPHHVVRDQRQRDRQEHPDRDRGVHQREIDKAPHRNRDRAYQGDPSAAEAIGEVPEKRDRYRRYRGGDQQRGQQHIARTVRYGRPIAEDEGGKDVERPLLAGPHQRGQDDLFRLPSDHLDDRGAFNAVALDQLGKDRGLE